jgi:hypothetical protein
MLYDFHHATNQSFCKDDKAAGLNLAPDFVDTGMIIIDKDNVDFFLDFNYYD